VGASETAGEHEPARLPKEIEDAIRAVGSGGTPEQDALTLAAIANRAIAELNKLARAEANARRGQPEWGAWASLANTARDAVLKLAAARKVAGELARKAE
jgi:hypothetical protein